MQIVKLLMVIGYGLIMCGGYLALLMAVAQFTGSYLPNFGLPVFLAIGMGLALVFMRLQTYVERLLIQRHVKRNPDSSWRYTAQ